MFNMILASTLEGGIGLDNKIPWNYPLDFKLFKALTLNHPIVMGAKTWESLPKKPLPNRDNIVITSNHYSFTLEQRAGAEPKPFYSKSIENVLEIESTHNLGYPPWVSVYWVIGGASIYKQFIPHVTYVAHSEIKKPHSCDTFFNIHE